MKLVLTGKLGSNNLLGAEIMDIEIPTEFFPFVKAAIARGGAYASEHDVVTHAMRLWQRHE